MRILILLLIITVNGFTWYDTLLHSGSATWYNASGPGACSFSNKDTLVAALNRNDYNRSQACGAFVNVVGPRGDVTVMVADICPGCSDGSLDLSKQAFKKIAKLSDGRVKIQWRFVENRTNVPLSYHFKKNSSRYWAAIQVRNSVVPISKLEVKNRDGSWSELVRTDYNYFIARGGLGDTLTLQLTDCLGRLMLDSGVVFSPGKEVVSHSPKITVDVNDSNLQVDDFQGSFNPDSAQGSCSARKLIHGDRDSTESNELHGNPIIKQTP